MSVSIQELDNTVQAFYEGKGDLVCSFLLRFEKKKNLFVFCFFSRLLLLCKCESNQDADIIASQL